MKTNAVPSQENLPIIEGTNMGGKRKRESDPMTSPDCVKMLCSKVNTLKLSLFSRAHEVGVLSEVGKSIESCSVDDSRDKDATVKSNIVPSQENWPIIEGTNVCSKELAVEAPSKVESEEVDKGETDAKVPSQENLPIIEGPSQLDTYSEAPSQENSPIIEENSQTEDSSEDSSCSDSSLAAKKAWSAHRLMMPRNSKQTCNVKLSKSLKKFKPKAVSKPPQSRKNQLLLDSFIQVATDLDLGNECQTKSPLDTKALDRD